MTGALGAGLANPTQVVENLPSSLVGLASAFPGKSAEKLEPAYGMVYRFVVTIDELHGAKDLGKWQSCAGLKMEFNPVPLKSGGNYTSLRYLPGNVSFPKVTLKRAVERKSSDAVQRWLSQAAQDWITGKGKDNPGQVTITLHDPHGEVVLTYHLHNARPSAWSGPDMDANSSKVAIETLELVHEGFEVHAGKSTGPKAGSAARRPVKLRLTELDGTKRWIQFENTPEKIIVSRNTEQVMINSSGQGSAEDQSGETATGSTGTTMTAPTPNMTKLDMSDLYIVKGGVVTDVVDLVDLLLEWMGKNVKGDKTKNILPKQYYLTMKWGNFERKVWLSGLKSEFVRFDDSGVPIRAKIGLTLNVDDENRKPARGNPTSGGIPDRKSHLLTFADNLPLLAHANYGNTARWRDIAEANDLDDPLRARPGHRLFLPAPAELGGGR